MYKLIWKRTLFKFWSQFHIFLFFSTSGYLWYSNKIHNTNPTLSQYWVLKWAVCMSVCVCVRYVCDRWPRRQRPPRYYSVILQGVWFVQCLYIIPCRSVSFHYFLSTFLAFIWKFLYYYLFCCLLLYPLCSSFFLK